VTPSATTTETGSTPRQGRPSGPRAAAREQAILDAALSLVMEVGYESLSMDALAERAHAGKATIYRHWSGKAEVVVEAIRRRKCADQVPPTDTGSLRGDLLASLHCSMEAFSGEDSALIVGVLSAMQKDRELADLMHQQVMGSMQLILNAIVDQAVVRGDLPVIAVGRGTVANEVISALFFNRIAMNSDPIDDQFLVHVVDDIVLPLLHC